MNKKYLIILAALILIVLFGGFMYSQSDQNVAKYSKTSIPSQSPSSYREVGSISSNKLTTANGFILDVPNGWTIGVDAPDPNYPHTVIYDANKAIIAQIGCPAAPKAEGFEEVQNAQKTRTFSKAGTTMQASYNDFASSENSTQIVEADVYLAPKGFTYEDFGADERTASTCRIMSSGPLSQDILVGFKLMYQTAR